MKSHVLGVVIDAGDVVRTVHAWISMARAMLLKCSHHVLEYRERRVLLVGSGRVFGIDRAMFLDER
jgi:hypothetical protein